MVKFELGSSGLYSQHFPLAVTLLTWWPFTRRWNGSAIFTFSAQFQHLPRYTRFYNIRHSSFKMHFPSRKCQTLHFLLRVTALIFLWKGIDSVALIFLGSPFSSLIWEYLYLLLVGFRWFNLELWVLESGVPTVGLEWTEGLLITTEVFLDLRLQRPWAVQMSAGFIYTGESMSHLYTC